MGFKGKKKILHILSSATLFGAENIAAEICLMTENIYDVTYSSPVGNIRDILSKKGVQYEAVQKYGLIGIRQVINKVKPDIIHAHDNRASFYAFAACMFIKTRPFLISHIHNSYPYLEKKSFLKAIDCIFRRHYDANIFCSENVRVYYEKFTNYYKALKNITVLENFINPDRILEAAEKNIVKLDENAVKIGFLGRLEDQKGLFEFFTELHEQIQRIGDRVHIYIVGSGGEEKKLKNFAESKLSKIKITFMEFQYNPYTWLKQFDLLILPSKYEGLPLTVLEAMALKVPVLAMNVGSLKEIIHDGENGWLIESKNYCAFTDKLITLCSDKHLLESVGEIASKTIFSQYNIKGYKNKILELYKKVLSEA
ncbi:MAG: glycosyltransferase [Clostridiales bacterium]|nr:glycosyltransferase [Clostridiales bacterium]